MSDQIISMDRESFSRLSTFVTQEYGIKLPPAKKPMLEARLNKKLRTMGVTSYAEFLDIIFSDEGRRSELIAVIDLITTNKTDFFRESAHFDFMSTDILPQLASTTRRNVKVWSAGCSTGEEPYTIAMVLEEFRKKDPGISYQVDATDISFTVLEKAFHGIYDLERIQILPVDLKRKYFSRKKTELNVVRVKPEYRQKIRFGRLNLMDGRYPFNAGEFDMIFCRNVLIYFDKPTQEKVIKSLCRHLRPGGYLFLGHSESIVGMNLTLHQVRPTIYRIGE